MMDGIEIITGNTIAHVNISLNKYNSFDMKFLDNMLGCLDDLEMNEDVSGVIIAGNEYSFCTGADIQAVAGYSEDECIVFLQSLDLLLYRIYYFTKPIVSILTGHALGGGLSLAQATDYSVTSDSEKAKFGFPEYKLGLSFTRGMVEILLSKPSASLHPVLTGEKLNAQEAIKAGYINEICQGDLKTSAISICEELISVPHASFQIFKEQFRPQITKPDLTLYRDEYLNIWLQMRVYISKQVQA